MDRFSLDDLCKDAHMRCLLNRLRTGIFSMDDPMFQELCRTCKERIDKCRLHESIDIPEEFVDITEYKPVGVYALFLSNLCVYVGQSKTNVLSRIGQHATKFGFDRVLFWACDDVDVDQIEFKMIRHFNPIHNKAMKGPPLVDLEAFGIKLPND